jgi:hypothetical protein
MHLAVSRLVTLLNCSGNLFLTVVFLKPMIHEVCKSKYDTFVTSSDLNPHKHNIGTLYVHLFTSPQHVPGVPFKHRQVDKVLHKWKSMLWKRPVFHN